MQLRPRDLDSGRTNAILYSDTSSPAFDVATALWIPKELQEESGADRFVNAFDLALHRNGERRSTATVQDMICLTLVGHRRNTCVYYAA